MTLRRLRGRPRWPVRTFPASSNGSTWARSSPLAGVVRLARGMPRPSVRLWMRLPLPFPPWATPAPPPFPGGKSAIHGAILPMNHPTFLGNPQNPGWHRGQRAIGLPALQPALRRALRRLVRPTRDIAPATAGDQHVEQGIQDFAERDMGHSPAALRRCRGKEVLEQAPFSITDAFKSSCHTTLLYL
jgi:hypothetical protein